MATSTTSDLQVIPFHNCEGCILNVKRALRKFNGLRLIEMDPENGIFTISTSDPEAIRTSLQQKFPKKSIILLPKMTPHNSSVHQSSCVTSRESTVDFKDMTRMLMTSSQAERIQSVECRHDVLRVRYYEKRPIITKFANDTDSCKGATKPSAPPLPTTECYAYGYPINGSHDCSTTETHAYRYP